MKILLDGLNLGLREGTGIATYARNIAAILSRAQTEFGVLYGLRRQLSPHSLAGADNDHWFFQGLALGNDGYIPKQLASRLAALAALPFGNLLRGPRARPVRGAELIEARSLTKGLPAAAQPYNIPGLYDQAFARMYLVGRFQKFRCPPDVDIFHCTTVLPVIAANAPNVCTVHDVIPLKLPGATAIDLDTYAALIGRVLRQYDRIVTVSEASKRDIVELFGCDDARIDVTYQHVDISDLSDTIGDAVVEKYLAGLALAPGGYLLCVGAVEPKKNLPRMIKAYAESSLDIPLVIVGKDGWLTDESLKAMAPLLVGTNSPERREARGRKHILRLQYVSLRELVCLYRGAAALMFCSLYEGFGLPALEAFSLGCPVVASNNSSLPEIVGDAGLQVDPYDVAKMRDALDLLCSDASVGAELRRKGRERARHFSAARHADSLDRVYRRVLGRAAAPALSAPAENPALEPEAADRRA